jgi:hypothetical protein
MNDIRNAYGFPIITKIEAARKYAAEATERNKPQCTCATCQYVEKLPAVQRLTTNWRPK